MPVTYTPPPATGSEIDPAVLDGKANKSGDTFTGLVDAQAGVLLPAGNPPTSRNAAHRGYVDGAINTAVTPVATAANTAAANAALALETAAARASVAYVDAAIGTAITGMAWKASVKAVVTGTFSSVPSGTSGSWSSDGVTLAVGDRVIVASSNNQSINGIYVVAAGTWTRAADADTANELRGATAVVEQGTVYADRIMVNAANWPITLGTTAITWIMIAPPTTYTAGTGLSLAANQFAVDTTVIQRRQVSVIAKSWTPTVNLDEELQNISTDGTGTALQVTGFNNGGVGKSVRIRLNSASTADTLTFSVAGTAVTILGGQFFPGLVNWIDIMQCNNFEFLVVIIPQL